MTFYRPHERLTLDTGENSRTRQSFRDETDINTIMAKYARTGLLEHVNEHQGQYGDFTKVPEDYHDACNQVLAAEQMFQTIPAGIRARFNNDPGAFLDFADDPANEDEMRSLGLLPSKMAAEQPPARAVEPSPASTAADPVQPAATPEGGSEPAPSP